MVGKGFGWGAVPQVRMQPLTVVEDLNVFRDRESCFRPRVEPLPVVHLVLQGGEERLGGGVIPAPPGPPDTGPDVVVGTETSELVRCVLAAPIAVKDPPGRGVTAGDGHGERVGDQAGAHVL